jgi:IclR family acetate operon transcriptional repressor
VLTARALIVGRRAMGEVGIREAASVPMIRLRDLTHETINLSLLDGEERLVLVERVDSDQAIRTYAKLGGSSPLHATASGRAVLAALPDELVERLIAAGLPRFTPNTFTAPEALRADVQRTRREGYAVNVGGNRPNGTLSARRGLHRVAGLGLVYEEPKADRSRRTLALPLPLVEALLSEGVHSRVVMEVLGHAQMRTNTYSQAMPALGRDAADRMGDALWD